MESNLLLVMLVMDITLYTVWTIWYAILFSYSVLLFWCCILILRSTSKCSILFILFLHHHICAHGLFHGPGPYCIVWWFDEVIFA